MWLLDTFVEDARVAARRMRVGMRLGVVLSSSILPVSGGYRAGKTDEFLTWSARTSATSEALIILILTPSGSEGKFPLSHGVMIDSGIYVGERSDVGSLPAYQYVFTF